MNIALVEFVDEAKALIKEFENGSIDKDKTIIIGLNPHIRIFLKEKNFSSKSTLEYFDSQAHARALERSEEIVSILEDNISIKDELGIKETYNNSFIFYVRLIISYYLNISEILENISRKHNISEITVCQSDNLPFDSPDLKDSERYLGLLTQRYAKAHNIKFRKIDIQTYSNSVAKNDSWFKKLLTIPIIWNHSIIMRIYRNRRSVLIGDFAYNMDFLVDDFKKSIPKAYWILFRTRKKDIFSELMASFIWLMFSIIKKSIKISNHKASLHYALPFYFFKEYLGRKKSHLDRDNMDKAKESIKNTFSKFHDTFSYKGINFSDLLLDKINVGIFPFIRQLEKDTAILYHLMKRINPYFVISPVARDIYFSLGEISKILNIPSLLISHASHIKPKNRLEEIEHDHLGRGLINTEYSLVAIQSPHARDYAKYFNIKSQVINTGPLLWGRANRARREIYEQLIGPYEEDKRILLHAGTPKTRAGIRFHIYETLDEYVDGIKDIIDAIEMIGNVLLVIQFRSWSGLSIEDLRASLPASKKVIFSTNTAFRDIVSLADILISFSSTTIEEALHNKIPVLLYGGSGRYVHLPVFEINDSKSIRRCACYHVSEKVLLRDAIDWVLNEHTKKRLTQEELRGYVFQEDEKQSIGDFIAKCIG